MKEIFGSILLDLWNTGTHEGCWRWTKSYQHLQRLLEIRAHDRFGRESLPFDFYSLIRVHYRTLYNRTGVTVRYKNNRNPRVNIEVTIFVNICAFLHICLSFFNVCIVFLACSVFYLVEWSVRCVTWVNYCHPVNLML